MKKFLTSLIVIAFSVQSQAMFIGPTLGVRMNNVSTDISSGAVTYNQGTTFQFGGLLLFGLVNTLMVRTGVIFAGSTTGITQSGVTTTNTINYLNLPLGLQFEIPATPLYVYGGGIYGLKMSDSCSMSTANPCTPNNSSSNISLDIGAGYNILDMGFSKLSFEIEYQLGLSNTNALPLSTNKLSAFAGNVNWVFGF